MSLRRLLIKYLIICGLLFALMLWGISEWYAWGVQHMTNTMWGGFFAGHMWMLFCVAYAAYLLFFQWNEEL